jgi:hypothetical protein
VHLPVCLNLLIEALRMGAILTTLFHLALQAGNQYSGVYWPLHNKNYMKHSNVRCIAILLWTIPSALLLLKFFVVENTLGKPCVFE